MCAGHGAFPSSWEPLLVLSTLLSKLVLLLYHPAAWWSSDCYLLCYNWSINLPQNHSVWSHSPAVSPLWIHWLKTRRVSRQSQRAIVPLLIEFWSYSTSFRNCSKEINGCCILSQLLPHTFLLPHCTLRDPCIPNDLLSLQRCFPGKEISRWMKFPWKLVKCVIQTFIDICKILYVHIFGFSALTVPKSILT